MTPDQLLALQTGKIDGWKYQHFVTDLGTLKVPSGRLEASDPFVNLGTGMVIHIAPGEYPVHVTLADVSDEQDARHLRETYLSLVLADGSVARVEYLVPEGEPVPESADEFYGIGVDAGTVGFADQEAVQRCMPEDDWYDEVFDNDTDESWFALMDSPDHLRAGSANIVMPLATNGENVVLTHSGWGDGVYPVALAYDEADRLLSVHIDLLVDKPINAERESPKLEPEPTAPSLGFLSRLFGPKPK